MTEHTRQSYNETTVLFFNFITNRTRRNRLPFLHDEYTRERELTSLKI